jgi:hypothetical protein
VDTGQAGSGIFHAELGRSIFHFSFSIFHLPLVDSTWKCNTSRACGYAAAQCGKAPPLPRALLFFLEMSNEKWKIASSYRCVEKCRFLPLRAPYW